MTQHTPRPWKTMRYGDLHAVVTSSNTYQVAICNGGHDDEANANLIAAAPELLALVRAYHTTYPLDSYADRACAAIAKATGLITHTGA